MQKMQKINSFLCFVLLTTVALSFEQCLNDKSLKGNEYKILFLHHSTGEVIYKGNSNAVKKLGIMLGGQYEVPALFRKYNSEHNTNYQITECYFPKGKPYPWSNDPYDYYNIWVKNAGEKPYMEEPTLEMLTKKNNLIILKHCYPVCDINEDSISGKLDSPEKTIGNYKLQYTALKNKLHEFPDRKFILWTGAARVRSQIDSASAIRARYFFDWVRNVWDQPGDNIYLWDFYELETEGGIFMKDEYSEKGIDSHPSKEFGAKVAPLFCQRIIDVIENNGNNTTNTGAVKK
jgi:hypothetical protein